MIDLEYIEQLKKELKYDEVYDYIMSYMEKDDPEAYYIYATWYDNGEVIDQDMSEAIHYYKIAMNMGHELARKRLAEYFYELGNYSREYALKASEREVCIKLLKDAKNKYSLAMNYGHVDACDKYFEIFDLFDIFKV